MGRTKGGLGRVGSHLLAGLGVEISGPDVSVYPAQACGRYTNLRKASDILKVVWFGLVGCGLVIEYGLDVGCGK